MKNKLDTTVYPNGLAVKNSVTGKYWSKALGFNADRFDASLVSRSEAAFLRATYNNVVDEVITTVADEVAAACNRTGEVGYYFNVIDLMVGASRFFVSPKADRTVEVYRLNGGANYMLHFCHDNKMQSFRMVDSIDKIPQMLLKWRANLLE